MLEASGAWQDWQRAQCRAVLARRLPVAADDPPGEILDSWARCLQAGLDFDRPLPLVVIEDADLRRRHERAGRVRQLALIELESLMQQIAGSSFLLAFADADGVVLDRYADQRFVTSTAGAGIPAGSVWTEHAAGTNGLGTALACGRPVAVNGPEHFFGQFSHIACTAAPIRDADGVVVGALDASCCFDSRQRHTQALVQMAAAHIENVLLAEQRRQHWVLAIHPRPEFVGTLSAGLLAFDGDGRLSACNGRAAGLLSGLAVQRGTPFEQLFNEPFDRFIGRLRSDGGTRLRDAMNSVLAVACVQPAAPPALAAPAGAPAAVPVLPTRTATATLSPAVATDDGAVLQAQAMVAAAVRRRLPILIQGETGTGKELLARHAHAASGREGAFVPVNCGGMPAELFEAELFGYAGGAFTGARRQGQAGLLASADGGTLLLDEVGELPLPLQAALLRFLDDGLLRPVGGRQWRAVDVQVLAATHVDLEAAVAAGRFRADLLWRLNTVSVKLPPLRLRADLAAQAQRLLAELEPQARLTREAQRLLAAQPWPGNFRELRACLARALLTHPTGLIDAADLQPLLPARATPQAEGPSQLQRSATEVVLAEFRRSGSVSQTARSLRISRTTVYRHLREAGVSG
ncbi:sigma-54-dependent Fis family transcriptional regulator [Aquincola tertiaricarbonis]|uniref:sigma-54-dependent Fis family transcriptional regulator n=1 Tax=Aquincola tertiaricarbonis TaxID=391953 RepID=UPI000698D176|nr:sigma-54-dependent Fis family transcriptional regulator [Aquincola tertiaricarbonis]